MGIDSQNVGGTGPANSRRDGTRVFTGCRTAVGDLSSLTPWNGGPAPGCGREETSQTTSTGSEPPGVADLDSVESVAAELLDGRTESQTPATVVSVLSNVYDGVAAALYRFDGEDRMLVPAALAPADLRESADPPAIPPGENCPWESYVRREVVTVKSDSEILAGVPEPIELVAGVGDFGVLFLGAAGMTDRDAELIARIVGARLDETTSAQRLRQKDDEIRKQRAERRQWVRLARGTRGIVEVAVEAGSYEELVTRLCPALLDLDHVDAAWVASPGATDGRPRIDASAGPVGEYLDVVTAETADRDPPPTVRALRDRTSVDESVADRPSGGVWRGEAVRQGIRSVTSVPLCHEGVCYGTLTVASKDFATLDGIRRDQLDTLAALVGHAVTSIHRRNALLADRGVELTLELPGDDGVFTDLADRLETAVHLIRIREGTGPSARVQFSPDQENVPVEEAVERSPYLTDLNPVATATEDVWETTVHGRWIGTTLADLGAAMEECSVTGEMRNVTVSLPSETERSAFLRRLEDRVGDVEFKATATRAQDQTPAASDDPCALLTARQREVLEYAYFSGYFEQPREQTGGEVADALGISQPAFSKQLRVAQRKLLTAVFE